MQHQVLGLDRAHVRYSYNIISEAINFLDYSFWHYQLHSVCLCR